MKFFVSAPNFTPSFNPDNSDIMRNMIVMEQLVGTLVKEKFANSGRAELYIAENWESDSTERFYTFRLKKGLKTSDGFEITAESFAQSLTWRLGHLAKNNDVPAFNKLKGWNDFIKKKSPTVAGITVDGDVLRFEFDSRPDGLLEYLAMPTFGFFSPTNYQRDSWEQLISSGPYEVAERTSSGVKLRKRLNWALNNNSKSPELIEYIYTDSAAAFDQMNDKSLFPIRTIASDFKIPDFLNVFQGAPTILTAVVLGTGRQLFTDRTTREIFGAKFRMLKRANPIASKYYFPTEAFYRFNETPHDENHFDGVLSNKEVTIGVDFTVNSPDIDYSLNLIKSTIEELGGVPKIMKFDHNDPHWIAKKTSNSFFDVRLASVDIGGAPENWVIQMMFCSHLGVGFPDPSGRICKLAKQQERSRNLNLYDFSSEFEKIVREDSSVLPVCHSGFIWLIGKSIDSSKLSPTALIPRADLLSVHD